MSYPTSSNLQSFLEALDLTLTAGQIALLSDAIAAGIAEFEGPEGANRKMLAGDAATRYFDPPETSNSVLFIPDLATLTSVVYQPLNATAETLTQNEDYWLEPFNAAADSKPYTMVRFRRVWTRPLSSSLVRSLQITGQWGYAESVPALAKNGMLAAGALQLFSQISHSATGGLLGWKDGDRSVDYGVQTWTRLTDAWQAQYAAAVRTYRKVSFG